MMDKAWADSQQQLETGLRALVGEQRDSQDTGQVATNSLTEIRVVSTFSNLSPMASHTDLLFYISPPVRHYLSLRAETYRSSNLR